MGAKTSPGELLRFWVTLERPVDRRAYLRHGLALAIVKYGVDTTLVFIATGSFWAPWSYLYTAPVMLGARFGGAPSWLAPTLVVWTLPFLWIGISLTLRRALDAGASAWAALLFFVPLVSYAMMVWLCLAPTREPIPRGAGDRIGPGEGRRLPTALLSMAIGTALGLGMLLFGVRVLSTYGLALFMGTPFVVGAVTAFVMGRSHPATMRETLEVVTMTAFLVAGAAFALGTEGVVCLLMVLPLGLVLTWMGGAVGHWIARSGAGSVRGAGLVLVLLPATAALEDTSTPASLREVVTSVVIAASPDVVWAQVIAFPPLAEPDELLFRLGVAYPTHAELRGEGVGAVRYCVFSTGAFVEPITRWEPGRRLSFDVTAAPPPLRELTPYRIAPPHLDSYLLPTRGEFRLVPLPDGRTRLEGSTWYEQRLRPEGYWALFSDAIIGMIHTRVLDHIRVLSEGAEQTGTAAR